MTHNKNIGHWRAHRHQTPYPPPIPFATQIHQTKSSYIQYGILFAMHSAIWIAGTTTISSAYSHCIWQTFNKQSSLLIWSVKMFCLDSVCRFIFLLFFCCCLWALFCCCVLKRVYCPGKLTMFMSFYQSFSIAQWRFVYRHSHWALECTHYCQLSCPLYTVQTKKNTMHKLCLFAICSEIKWKNCT